MTTTHKGFHVEHVLHELKHYLPAQAPLMDFVHHNTLHAFQHLPFHEALRKAQTTLGYQVYLSIDQFRELYHSKRINDDILNNVIERKKEQKKRLSGNTNYCTKT